MERRAGIDRRFGRPRVEVDLEVVDVLLEHGFKRERIADALKVGTRTIDRRIARRGDGSLAIRCHECGARTLVEAAEKNAGRCSNGHQIITDF